VGRKGVVGDHNLLDQRYRIIQGCMARHYICQPMQASQRKFVGEMRRGRGGGRGERGGGEFRPDYHCYSVVIENLNVSAWLANRERTVGTYSLGNLFVV
jgi:hypothetical protein